MVRMIEADRIFIAPKLKVNDFIINEEEEELEKLLEEQPDKIRAYAVDDFDEKFINGIYHDYALLKELNQDWENVHQDPKLDEFLYQIKNTFFDTKINDNGKIIVFSESKETTQYLERQLTKLQDRKVLAIDSSNHSEKTEIIKK